ncbi:MAG: hypothetical protein ACRCX8_05535 [Sarcina sp.]
MLGKVNGIVENYQRVLVLIKRQTKDLLDISACVFDDLDEGLVRNKHILANKIFYPDIIGKSAVSTLTLQNKCKSYRLDVNCIMRLDSALKYLTKVREDENVTKGIYGLCIIEDGVFDNNEYILELSLSETMNVIREKEWIKTTGPFIKNCEKTIKQYKASIEELK